MTERGHKQYAHLYSPEAEAIFVRTRDETWMAAFVRSESDVYRRLGAQLMVVSIQMELDPALAAAWTGPPKKRGRPPSEETRFRREKKEAREARLRREDLAQEAAAPKRDPGAIARALAVTKARVEELRARTNALTWAIMRGRP